MLLMDYDTIMLNNPLLFSNENALIKIITDKKEISSWQVEKRANLKSQKSPLEWADIGVVLNDQYILVIRDLVEFPGGKKGSYFRVLNQADLKGGQGVAVLSEMDNKFLLLHQYRHPPRTWSYEAPRGFGEPNTSAEQQAINEVSEEVEGEITKLVDLGIYYSNTGLEGNKVKLFYAKLKSVGKPAEVEGIEKIIWVTLSELETMIADERITDGFTIAAYTRAKLRGLI
jgi:ADP-ribose pyrophosphatase